MDMMCLFKHHTPALHHYKSVCLSTSLSLFLLVYSYPSVPSLFPCVCFNCNVFAIQEAIAVGFEHEMALRGKDESYFKQLPASLVKKRDLLAKLLSEAGMQPIVPEGGYFILADTAPLSKMEPWL